MKKAMLSIKSLIVMIMASGCIFFSGTSANVGAFTNSGALKNSLPISIGEKLIFQLRWGVIEAGEAVLESLPFQYLNGIQSHHFVLKLKTSSTVDIFYKIRERIESYTDVDISRSLFYRKKATGKDKKDIVINFDWEKQKASYSNFGNPRDSIDIQSGSFDPLSALFGIRNKEFAVASEITFPITDGKRCFIGKAHIVKKELIELNGTTYDTYLIEPELEHFDGVFKKSKDPELKIWMTADERKLPVRIECKVIVGSITGELVSSEM
ncbi:conserved exported hypothetical protein [Desulfamplus magnetovallimortis]|uniref:DUF3108 domain-containing protein n=1 Tax=Desulfamplus magnetovallimortis TaxID=1246637 RepID=A0A1W1HBN2_9BACT|nr:DUF3108 domain-containing protein [Desulfamplus magnetovallimortis]SLM29846.1 conserved exported hypothetical protein [Desulfamplus magnetovallimortis]